MQNKLAIFFFLFAFQLYPQITDIARFQFQDANQNYFESTPIVISENEILLFYCTAHSKEINTYPVEADTLFSSRSMDGGKSWGNPVIVSVLGKGIQQSGWSITSLRTNSGRILLAWSDISKSELIILRSDDNGYNWEEQIKFSEFGAQYCNLAELNDGRIIFSWNNGIRIKYYESNNDGTTWSSEPVIFYTGGKENVSFVSVDNEILAVFEYALGIFYQRSTDNGLTWSVEIKLNYSRLIEKNPSIVKFTENELWIIYQASENIPDSYSPENIYFIKSTDGGKIWGEPQRFTSYAGKDNFVKSTKYGNNSFITFSTTRFTNKPQIGYAVIGQTVEKFRPPYIIDIYAYPDNQKRKDVLIKANIIDDEKVVNAKVEFIDGSNAELYDDGIHNDGQANDGLFANTVLLNSLMPSSAGRIDVNKVYLPFNNKGIIASLRTGFSQGGFIEASDNEGYLCKLITDIETPSGPYVGGRFDGNYFLFSSGFFLSGYSNGIMWSNGVAPSNLIEDYMPGKVGSNENNPLNKIYTVLKNDPPFGLSWLKWSGAVSLGAEFYDGDGDGIYNPVDKNWNGTWDSDEDMPPIIGDIIAWCVYNDAVPKNLRRWNTVDPQGIEIRQTLFAIDSPELENVIFIKYNILNTGSVAEVMDSVYFGIYEDGDVGDATDDVVGCDTILQSGFYYATQADWQYGENPPSFFTTLLQGPIVITNNPSDTAFNFKGVQNGISRFPSAKNINLSAHRSFIGADPLNNDSDSSLKARYALQGKNNFGEFPDPCTFPYGEIRGGVDCNEINPTFWFSGDPVTNIGWMEKASGDKRNLVSTGPFQLEKGKPQEIIIAYVLGRGSDALNSVTVARENVQRAIQEYKSNFISMTYSPPPPVPITDYILYQNYPNPFNPTTKIRYELPVDGVVKIDVFDILGQRVRTLLNEYKQTGRYEVTFNSDGLASGIYIYKIQVNNFTVSKKMMILK